MRRRQADRRTRPRFEVIGDLWGTVETTVRLPLRNVALNGVLLESQVLLAVDSVHRISWDVDGHEVSAEVRVRHVRPVEGADGDRTYLVGVEFVTPSPLLAEQLRCWLLQLSSETEPSGA